jgi:hypothetical protein
MVAFSVAPGYRRSRPPMRPKLDPFVGIIDRILAQAPYDACEKRAARVNSLSLVRYRGNDYSVPTAYGHREVLMRAMSTRWLSPARQMRSRVIRDPTEREDFVFNPLNTWRCWKRTEMAAARCNRWIAALWHRAPRSAILRTIKVAGSNPSRRAKLKIGRLRRFSAFGLIPIAAIESRSRLPASRLELLHWPV